MIKRFFFQRDEVRFVSLLHDDYKPIFKLFDNILNLSLSIKLLKFVSIFI